MPPLAKTATVGGSERNCSTNCIKTSTEAREDANQPAIFTPKLPLPPFRSHEGDRRRVSAARSYRLVFPAVLVTPYPMQFHVNGIKIRFEKECLAGGPATKLTDVLLRERAGSGKEEDRRHETLMEGRKVLGRT